MTDKLPDLVADALAGNEVIITEHGTPVARWFRLWLTLKGSVLRVLIEAQSRRAKILMNPYWMGFGSASTEVPLGLRFYETGVDRRSIWEIVEEVNAELPADTLGEHTDRRLD